MLKTASRHLIWILLLSLLEACGSTAPPASNLSNRPEHAFKLAQYGPADERRVAIRVGEELYDLQRANRFISQREHLQPVEFPNTMLDLVARYQELKPRLYQIANDLAERPYADTESEGDSVLVPKNTRMLAPVLYPWNLLNVAVNYRQHGAEMGRDLDTNYRADDPYIFAKSPKASIIGEQEAVILPAGRDKIDWEVELAVVIGRKAKDVPPGRAGEYIFGYTLILDISDRGGRDRKTRLFNADWFSGKSRDRFAPLGPYIVPAEFIKDPNDLDLKLAVNDTVMQDSNTRYMIHDVDSLVAYITSVQTLEPGDIIATGTPPGVGAGMDPPQFLKPGDIITAEIEGICKMRTPIK